MGPSKTGGNTQRGRYRCTTISDHDQPVAANLLDRRFEAERPNQRWVGDVTEILTGQGKLYLAVILKRGALSARIGEMLGAASISPDQRTLYFSQGTIEADVWMLKAQ